MTSLYFFSFLSTPSARRATNLRHKDFNPCGISIHALREEGDAEVLAFTAELERFLSTPSARRATYQRPAVDGFPGISIHALREEGDRPRPRSAHLLRNFYPRPPRGGRRCWAWESTPAWRFLSTPSARRATHHARGREAGHQDFYPRPPRGGRPKPTRRPRSPSYFYPRPPRGGRRRRPRQTARPSMISIHALREEGDRMAVDFRTEREQFLSTPSARRATAVCKRSASCLNP